MCTSVRNECTGSDCACFHAPLARQPLAGSIYVCAQCRLDAENAVKAQQNLDLRRQNELMDNNTTMDASTSIALDPPNSDEDEEDNATAAVVVTSITDL